MAEGFDSLPRDKTRPSRIAPLGAAVAKRVVALTLTDPPAEATHWTAATMAEACGISISSVQRIWREHGLQPHRGRQFKLSTDRMLSTSCATWLVSMSIRRLMPSSCPSTKRPKSRRSTAPSQVCRPPSTASSPRQIRCQSPFTWTADPVKIIAAVKRGHQVLKSIHLEASAIRKLFRRKRQCIPRVSRLWTRLPS